MNAFVPSKTQLMTIGFTLVAMWAINNVGALQPLKSAING
jgi:hypothetical protein